MSNPHFEYLDGTIEKRIRFNPSSTQIYYWIDAAYGTHTDGRGHTGMIITVGPDNAPIVTKSRKQKLNTLSSTEAELVALDESVLHLLWLVQEVIAFMGYPQTPVCVYQDNKSTMTVCSTGQFKSGKLKHMAIRWHFINGKTTDKVIELVYVKTEDMLAGISNKAHDRRSLDRIEG